MNQEFRLPRESSNSDDDRRRIVDLIEEIRADIDFELDDAVTSIVRDLPAEYFQRILHEDQVIHLKGLLASRICQFTGELFLHSSDGNQIAVLGRSNYTGQLAKILSELPGKETLLVGANIFTSQSHDFILDVFEFGDEESLSAGRPDPEMVERLATSSGADTGQVSDFLSRFRPSTLLNGNTDKFAPLLDAYQSLANNPINISIDDTPDVANVLVAVDSTTERKTFEATAALISGYGLDIQQAQLEILRKDVAADSPAGTRSEKSILMKFALSKTHAQLPPANTWQTDLEQKLR